MIDLSSSCIFSGSTENLNTTMVVTLDDQKYKVAISEEYEDQAVPSKIKELVYEKANEREAKLQKLQQLAEELGIPLNTLQAAQQDMSTGLVLVENPPEPEPELEPEPPQRLIAQRRPAPDPKKMERVGNFRIQKNRRRGPANEGLTPEEAAAALEQAARDSSGEYARPTSREAPRFPSIPLPPKVGIRDASGNIIEGTKPENVAQKRQVVRGRAGIPISLPKTITSRAGDSVIETTINVVNTGGDEALQRRFKNHRYEPQCDYANECRACRGTGVIGRKKEECTRCNGTGILA